MPTAVESNRRQARLTAMGRLHDALADLKDIQRLFRMLHAELGRVMDTTGFILGLHDDASHMVEGVGRSEEHTSELQSRVELVCRLLLEKKKAPRRACRHTGGS